MNRFTMIDITWTNSTITDVDRIRQRFMRKSTNITEKKHVVSNDNEAGTEETGLDTVEKDNRGKSKLFNLKDTATL